VTTRHLKNTSGRQTERPSAGVKAVLGAAGSRSLNNLNCSHLSTPLKVTKTDKGIFEIVSGILHNIFRFKLNLLEIHMSK
jgi:hypothetical protein